MARKTSPAVWAVIWDDAHRDPGHYSTADAIREVHKPWTYTWVGILVHRNSAGITLAREVDASGEYRGLDFVPAELVRLAWRIGPVTPPKPKVVDIPAQPA